MGRALSGVLLALLGSAGLLFLVWLTNCGRLACEQAMISLGLAATGLLSAVFQAMILLGLWLLWSSRRR